MNRGIITIENGIVSVPASTEIWMTQHGLADLFGCFVSKVNANIRAILKTGVLDEKKVCRTHYYRNGGSVEQFNLEMIIALSFRIRSYNADIFRAWLTKKAAANTSRIPIIMGGIWNSTMLN